MRARVEEQSILPSLASTDIFSSKIIFRADKTHIAPYLSKVAAKFQHVNTYSFVRWAHMSDSSLGRAFGSRGSRCLPSISS